MSLRLRSLALSGCALAGLYLVVALASYRSGLVPIRPLYEGTAPPPAYRWVKPPRALAWTNQPPAGAKTTVALGGKGSVAQTVLTDDGQAIVSVQEGSIAPRNGQRSVAIEFEPLDPTAIGPPPHGLRYDGNAYRIAATYQPSGAPAEIRRACGTERPPRSCPTIVLRYAVHSTAIFRREGTGWTALKEVSPAPAALQVFAVLPEFGTYVAAGERGAVVGGGGSSLGSIIGIVVAAVAVAGSLVASRFRSVRRSWRRGAKRVGRAVRRRRRRASRRR